MVRRAGGLVDERILVVYLLQKHLEKELITLFQVTKVGRETCILYASLVGPGVFFRFSS